LTVGSIVAVEIDITAIEVQIPCIRTIYRRRPIVAVATCIVDGTITVIAITSRKGSLGG